MFLKKVKVTEYGSVNNRKLSNLLSLGSTLWLYLRECNALSLLVQIPVQPIGLLKRRKIDQPITQRFSKITLPFYKFLNMAAFSIIFLPRTKKMAGENQNTSKSVSFRPEILARSKERQKRQNVKSLELSKFEMLPKWKPGQVISSLSLCTCVMFSKSNNITYSLK